MTCTREEEDRITYRHVPQDRLWMESSLHWLWPCAALYLLQWPSCPVTKMNGGLSRLHSADEDAVSWLTSYGKWHAYEKKKIRHTAAVCLGTLYNITTTATKFPIFKRPRQFCEFPDQWQSQAFACSCCICVSCICISCYIFLTFFLYNKCDDDDDDDDDEAYNLHNTAPRQGEQLSVDFLNSKHRDDRSESLVKFHVITRYQL